MTDDRGTLDTLCSLAGRVAVVTGGARGIGLAAGRRLADAGATVVLADRSPRATGTTALPEDQRIHRAELDVTDRGAVRDLASEVVDGFERLDIWINNAGVFPASPILEMSSEEWDEVMAVDLKGVFLGAQAAARHMARLGTGGVIVNIGSTAGDRAIHGHPHYVAAKHGVHGLTRALAVDLAPHGIRVLTVAPGMIRTPGFLADGTMDADRVERVARRLPLGRIGTPDDVARVVFFCVTDLASYMTGSVVFVDGGQNSV